jgi:shikimate dehydrogenase
MKSPIISGKARVCGIIGDPVEHTMSPVMHNAAFSELGLDFVYLPFLVKKESLKGAIDGIKALNIRGLSVTQPHKVEVMELLDNIDPLAEKMGTVNTIVNDNGILTGSNTDADGFLQGLLERGIKPAGKNVVVLGAGGASRAVSFILADRGANLVILNRLLELDWAESLAERISDYFSVRVEALELKRDNLKKAIGEADILVNTTSVGMSPDIDNTLVDSDLLKPGLVVYDVIYNPIKTRLLIEAEKAGATIISGLDMLVFQGVIAFGKWTGENAPVEVMREAALKSLKNSGE